MLFHVGGIRYYSVITFNIWVYLGMEKVWFMGTLRFKIEKTFKIRGEPNEK